MTTLGARPSPVVERLLPRSGLARPMTYGIGFVVAVAVASAELSDVGAFPLSWNVHLADPINEARRWLISHQTTHWLYLGFLDPISNTVESVIRGLENVLGWLPWYGYLIFAGLGLWWTRGRRAGMAAVAGVVVIGVFQVWDEGLATLALMATSVMLSLLIGVPLGVASARNARTQRLVRPLLDAMQTLPGFVYLIPFVLLFGIGRVPAVVATMIYALPPVVRLTDLGLRGVDPTMVEASSMFGATERQTLFKVQLPQALPAILAGVNQTIMMAMGLVVIAALIGAGGLGQIVLRALQTLKVGQAVEAGLAIVIMAILLDRFSSGLASLAGASGRSAASESPGLVSASAGRAAFDRRWLPRLVAGGAVISLVGGLAGHRGFPEQLSWHPGPSVDRAVDWAKVNLYFVTGPFSDFVTLHLVTPLRELLSTDIPWPVLIAATAVLALGAAGWRTAAGTVIALFGIGLLGMWELSMDTLAQSIVAVVTALVLGVPLGIAAGRRPRFRAVLNPVLDFLQTIPSFVLLVPVIMLFNVGRIPGIMASVLYALPAAVHFTALGLRSVPDGPREAARSFGATGRQRLTQVELPLAAPAIMMAVNQTIMLVLAMVVIAGMVGGAGLGFEAVKGLKRSDSVGVGFEAGIAIVLLAGVLDQLTRGVADRLRPPAA